MSIPQIPLVELNDGWKIPANVFGTPDAPKEQALAIYLNALDSGWRALDTARSYGNEDVVGAAIAQTSVPRSEIFVTSKVAGRHHGYDQTLAGFETSMSELGLEYLDLYLIHWPNPAWDKYVDTWRAMVKLRGEGRVRSFGVSNFTTDFILRLQAETGVLPAVNQIERHPFFPNAAQVRANTELGVVTESWSSLGHQGAELKDPVIVELAAARGVSVAQILLRWNIQGGAIPVSYTRQPQRVKENLDVYSFELTPAEMDAIDTLARPDGAVWGSDPATEIVQW
ncbi:MAG: aldo/keto reductase [Propionibacteriaceae bacterium]|jgi:diketogulonate reductase-like aldo/keto reductase|nr:aldo/keto reductase [Propionibacteriaceae bacterium]